ncbi:hypothetical protein FD724_21230 [Nostoc sp. C057]|uniref:hypothetical protein n=1 Tax=Nostoc sp. C057 TaxID=2576903 RepID=UPI0015C3CB42|nr:hypothetical protein [Nostoc sp. C057]QLE50372.1 hypothetical protein FD724_21230 [Nostoc sp. C057]
MSLQEEVAQIFRNWGSGMLEVERKALREKASKYTVDDWKAEHIVYVAGSGALTGAIGGPVGLAAILPDLFWCKKVGTQGCLGIGYIKGYVIDYENDMNMILAVWSDLAEATVSVPVGKVGIKISNKILPKVAGKVVEKVILKGSSKIGAKLAAKAASKAATKLTAKLAAKTGVGWIPLIGGVVSAGINWWLLSGLLDAAETYYKSDYIVLKDDEISSLA